MAAVTGLTTVADFRQSDVAVGGQGAPLVPWTDWVLFGRGARHRAVQNIGGVANVTWLPAGGQPEDVVAFDTGPGNMVIDGLAGVASRGRQRMDRDGRRARENAQVRFSRRPARGSPAFGESRTGYDPPGWRGRERMTFENHLEPDRLTAPSSAAPEGLPGVGTGPARSGNRTS